MVVIPLTCVQGKGIAEKFKAEGAEVIIADFVEDAGKKTADELKCEFAKCNVTQRADWEAVVKLAEEKFGRIDCVINVGVSRSVPISGHKLTCSAIENRMLEQLTATR